ncbi:cyclic pyranopterin monophosphate synthase MoaC [Bacteroidota bacterium]
MGLSHLDENGKPKMVDVSGKSVERRTAEATGLILLQNVLLTAQIAGIQAAKKTAELIPLCHPLDLKKIDLDTRTESEGIRVNSRVVCIGQTGAEMEALQAVSTALLTIYDMCKAVDKNMVIEGIHLLKKTKERISEKVNL